MSCTCAFLCVLVVNNKVNVSLQASLGMFAGRDTFQLFFRAPGTLVFVIRVCKTHTD